MTRVFRAKSQVLVMARKALHHVAFRAPQSHLPSQHSKRPRLLAVPWASLELFYFMPFTYPAAASGWHALSPEGHGNTFSHFLCLCSNLPSPGGLRWPHPSTNPHPHPFALHFIFLIARITFYYMICLCIMFLVYSLSTHVRIDALRGQKSSCVLLTSVF